MADTATEMEAEMVDTMADLEKTTHGKGAMKAMGTTTILASSEDTRCSRTAIGLSCGGFLEYSVFLPFITRGKPFFDAIHSKVVLLSPHTCSHPLSTLTTFTRHKSFLIYFYGNGLPFRPPTLLGHWNSLAGLLPHDLSSLL